MTIHRRQLPLAAGLVLAATVGAPVARAASFSVDLLPVIEQHCVSCHGGEKTKGKVDLKRFTAGDGDTEALGIAGLGGEPELLEKMIEALEYEEMPPEEEPQPTAAERTAWVGELESMLDEALTVAKGAPTERAPMRRMNRFEYNNAVRDLFDLKVNLFSLPEMIVRRYSDYFQPDSSRMPDEVKVGNRPLGKSQLIEKRLLGVNPFPQDQRAEHGYNNRGDHLSLSPILMESFLGLSQSIVNAENFPENCGTWDSFFAAPQTKPTEARAIASERLSALLRRAIRGPIHPDQLERYMKRFDSMTANGVPFEDRMRALASAALVSPRFLYVYDTETDADPGAVTDLELASRLSFYLWSSLPDDELLTLAERGRLSEPDTLRAQVRRMTRHPNIQNFCDSFPAQWLGLDRLIGARPDPERFPDYYFAKFVTGLHMQLEPLLLFEALFIEDRPVTQLIDSDFTYRTDKLDNWYRPGQHPNARDQPTAITYHRVPITDRRYGGVITNAAVLTMTSSPLRTQPITRGAWITSVIFNDPPEPPPAQVPVLDEDDEVIEAEGQTLREQLIAHRERPDCAACHRKIDPLGFALEQYDPVGRWRETYRTGLPINASGELFNKRAFRDAVGFKDAILKEKDTFARALAEHLLSYALGRKLGPTDRISIDQIVARTESAGYGLRTLIEEVALSPAVTGQPPEPSRRVATLSEE
ncbi:MAG: DUF1592 domain-containing protein [Planctomycetota bacterium]|jgi:hypothetical protein